VPGEVAALRLEKTVFFEFWLAGAVFQRGVIADEADVWVVVGRFFEVARVREMAERARLGRETFVNAEEL
jgi:hypothetical protein